MGIVRFSAVTLAVLALAAAAASAGGFENSGVGTKARGMAGAFRATADDWTAAYYNPAGYANLYDNQLGADVAFVHYRNEIIPDYRWDGLFETGMYNDRTNFNAHEILSNPSGGFLVRLPVWGETVFGLSAYQLFDHNTTWTMYAPLPVYHDSVTLPADQFRNNLDVVAFQLTAAREFNEEKLYLGAGLQVLRGDLLYTNIYFRDNPIRSAQNPTYDLMADRPYEHVTEWSKNDGNGWGFGFTGGMLWQAGENLKVGANIRVPFSFTVSGRAENRFYMPKNNTLTEISSDSAAISNPGTVGHLFLSGQTVVDSADFETNLDLPVSLGVGFALEANDKLTVALDAEYTFWSMFEGFEFAYSKHQGLTGPADTAAVARDFFTSDLSAPVEWDDAIKAMLGASYDAHPKVTLLGGVAFDQSPASETRQFTPQFVDTGDKWRFSFGFITHIQRWDLGLVTTYQPQPDLTVDGFQGYDDDDAAERFPGEYKAETYETILSFNYRF